MTESRAGSSAARSSARSFIRNHLALLALIVLLLLTTTFFSITADNFLTVNNFLNVLRQAAPALIVATAMTFVMVAGGIDLSVGSLAALTGGVGALALAAGWGVIPAVLLMLGTGAAAGAVSGYFAAYEGVPAFIVTLAGLTAYRGMALLMSEGQALRIDNDSFLAVGQGDFLGVGTPIWLAGAVIAGGWVLFNLTTYGLRTTAVGSNYEATRRAGIDTRLLQLSTFVMSGVCAAIAGIVIAARLSAASSQAGTGLELQVITGVVLGGTAMTGGQGSILGSALGILLLLILENGLVLLHVDVFYVSIAQGVVLLIALWLHTRVLRTGSR